MSAIDVLSHRGPRARHLKTEPRAMLGSHSTAPRLQRSDPSCRQDLKPKPSCTGSLAPSRLFTYAAVYHPLGSLGSCQHVGHAPVAIRVVKQALAGLLLQRTTPLRYQNGPP